MLEMVQPSPTQIPLKTVTEYVWDAKSHSMGRLRPKRLNCFCPISFQTVNKATWNCEVEAVRIS